MLKSMWKKLVVESLLKNGLRTPSQWNIPTSTLRFSLEKICKIFPKNTQDLHFEHDQLAGLPVEKISPNNSADHVILFIHGGLFMLGSQHSHRALMCSLVQRTQLPVIHIDYPLAPEQPFPAAFDALYQAYHALLNQGVAADHIILAGDCAGANLALSLNLRLLRENAPQPCGLVLMSPLLDLTLSSESLRFNQQHDALLSLTLIENAIQHYIAPHTDRDDPRVSPLFDQLQGLPKTLVQVGSKALLLDDAQRFRAQAKKAGVEVEFKLYTGMWHNFFMFDAWFDESKQALADLAAFVHHLKSND